MMDGDSAGDMGDKFFEQWRKSSGHNHNMLRDGMNYVGIACVGRPGGYYDVVYATQIFWRQAYEGSAESPSKPVTVPPTATQPQMPEDMPKEQPEKPEEPEMPKDDPADMPDRGTPKGMDDKKYGYDKYHDYSFTSDDESMSSGDDAMMSPDDTGMDSGSGDEMEEKKDRRRRRRRSRRESPKETEIPEEVPADMPDDNDKRPFWYSWWVHDGSSDDGKKSHSDSSDDNDHHWFFNWFW